MVAKFVILFFTQVCIYIFILCLLSFNVYSEGNAQPQIIHFLILPLFLLIPSEAKMKLSKTMHQDIEKI